MTDGHSCPIHLYELTLPSLTVKPMSCLSSSLRQPSRENIFLSTCTSWLRPKGLEIKMVQNSLATKGRNTTIPTFNNYHLCWLPPNIYFTSILRQIHQVGTNWYDERLNKQYAFLTIVLKDHHYVWISTHWKEMEHFTIITVNDSMMVKIWIQVGTP